MVPLSILDASPIAVGSSVQQALVRSLRLAQVAERLGYRRFWLTEHHNIAGMASAATAVLIGYVAGATRTIRVGAGGIMLANHSPLVIAEQFGTLATLYPSRIDLGIGRASGADESATRALQRYPSGVNRYASDVEDLIGYLWNAEPRRGVRSIPGHRLQVPIWILGSSRESASLAAAHGRPFAFASHFAPTHLMAALDTYRTRFEPSEQLSAPYVMLGFNAIVANDEGEARLLASSMQQAVVNLRNGRAGELPPPSADYERTLASADKIILNEVLRHSAFGCASMVCQQLDEFVRRTGTDEIIVSSACFDPGASVHSLTLLAEAWSGAR